MLKYFQVSAEKEFFKKNVKELEDCLSTYDSMAKIDCSTQLMAMEVKF